MKILIIKTGQFETFAEDTGDSHSLGDVLRTTTLLRGFNPRDEITWLTHKKAMPLLTRTGTPLRVDELKPESIPGADLVINLEKNPALIPFLNSQKKVAGFVFKNGTWQLVDQSGKSFSPASTWGKSLHGLLRFENLNPLPLYSAPDTPKKYDIGFNWHVGHKWNSKKMGEHLWKKMEADLSPRFRISWQQGLDSIEDYALWIAGNRLLISLDSLGLHLAHAMEVPVLALFGATDEKLHDAGPRSRFLKYDAPYDCLPCWKNECSQKIHCSEHVDFNKIYTQIDSLLTKV